MLNSFSKPNLQSLFSNNRNIILGFYKLKLVWGNAGNIVFRKFSCTIKPGNLKNKKSLAKTTESMRLVYYDLVVKILREKKQVIPCYAGISNIHLNYDGNIWPCCVLGYAHSMGNIRDYDFDYDALYNSQKAKEVRKYIKEGNCYCPLANQSYSNMIISLPYLMKVFGNYWKYI